MWITSLLWEITCHMGSHLAEVRQTCDQQYLRWVLGVVLIYWLISRKLTLINRLISNNFGSPVINQKDKGNCWCQLQIIIYFDDMFYMKLWTSPQLISTHFSQSRRQTSDDTFADKRAAHVLFKTYPNELKRHSHWSWMNVSSAHRKYAN